MKAKKSILIIEDEASLLNALALKFKKEHFEVLTAKDGKEGFSIALQKHPDITLLDILLPVLDGITMWKKVLKDPWGQHAKAIILTNLRDGAKAREALGSGLLEYVVKTDLSIQDIVKKVKANLRNPL